MSTDYVEAILTWSDTGPSPDVGAWLQAHGLLVAGGSSIFESAFGAPIDRTATPQRLPIPAALRPHVGSIVVPRIPAPHDR